MIAKNPRCHIKKMGETRQKIQGVINFSILKKLSSNLYDTLEKCVLYTRKIRYYTMVFWEGVVCFMTPYDTFMTPFDDNKGYSSALRCSRKDFFMTPFTQKSYHPSLQAGLQGIDGIQGVIFFTCLTLKGVMKGVVKKYDTLIEQEVLS